MSHDAASALPVEARSFQQRRAGIVTRVLASTVDFITVSLALVVLYALWNATAFLIDPYGFAFAKPTQLGILLAGELLLLAYFTASWATTGRTYGAHVMGLRVVDSRGNTLPWIKALVRSVFCLLFPFGLLWVLINKENRSLQDLVLRTSVIYDWRPR
jgi:uncharacterized RDD family membrane protein YckC